MKRLLLLTLAVAAAISLVAVMGVRSFSGSTNVASAHNNDGTPSIEIDLVNNGTGWCDPAHIDASASRIADGTAYQVAVCLSDAADADGVAQAVGSFQFDLLYNRDGSGSVISPAIDTCTDKSGDVTDANPDANAGTTTFSTPSLGTGWDCNVQSTAPPTCAHGGAGDAFIKCLCNTTTGCTSTLLTGAGVSKPLAVITLKAMNPGTDHLNLVNGYASNTAAGTLLSCGSGGGAPCYGAIETKELAPPTATPTAIPAQCDIGVSVPMAANPPALNLKVGDAPTVANLTETWKNFGATTSQTAATCNFATAMGAAIYVSGGPDAASLVTTAIDPTKLAVRMVPAPMVVYNLSPLVALPGDVCLNCTSTQGNKSIGDCLDPLKGAKGPFDPDPTPLPSTWTYQPVPCQEDGFDAGFPLNTSTLADGGCRDTVDNDADGKIDWDGYSAVPDTDTCVSVQSIGLIPGLRTMLAPDAIKAQTRQVEIDCLARGVYPLFVFGGNSQATDSVAGCPNCPVHNVPPASDPNDLNNSSGTVVMVTCTAGPEMVKDCDTSTEGIQTACNLWLMDPNFAGGVEPGTSPPVTLPKADDNGCVLPALGKGCLAVDVWLKSAGDDDDSNDSDLLPECLGAWEHQIRFDHKILRFVDDLNPETLWYGGTDYRSWLESTGRIAHCDATVLEENSILEGCTTKDDPNTAGMQVGPCGDGIIEQMLIVPQTNDLIYRGVFRPTKDNGVVTNIVDDNCEITDIYAEPMADTLPGGLTPICGDLTITVRMLEGDTDLDCDVDVIDDAALAMRYGASWGLQLYDQWFDLEPKYADQDIDIKDLQFVFGRNYSTCQDPIPDDQATPVDPGQP
jgi:hypothetical protein